MTGFIDPSQNDERIFQLPFTIPTIVLSLMGIVGNAHVLHILRKYYGVGTSYTIILTYLVACDLSSCVGMLLKEVMERVMFPLKYLKAEVRCPVPNYFGYVGSKWSMWLVLLISYDRYRAVCFPLSLQMTKKRTNLLCIGMGCISVCSAVPVLFMYGVRSFSLPDFPNGSECGIKDSMRSSFIPTLYYAVLAVVFVVMVVVVGWFYARIWQAVQNANAARRKLSEAPSGKSASCVPRRQISRIESTSSGHATVLLSLSSSSIEGSEEEALPKPVHGYSPYGNLKSNDETRQNKDDVFVICETAIGFNASSGNCQIMRGNSATVLDVAAKPLSQSRGKDWRGIKTSIGRRQKIRNKKRIRSEQDDSSSKLTQTAVTITILYFLCYTTMLVSLSVQAWPSTEIATTRTELFAYRYLFSVVFINNVFNPAVYFLNDPRFRSGFAKMYSCK